MKLANCNEHPNMADRNLPCFALRHEDGRRVTADEMFEIVKQRDDLLAALIGMLDLREATLRSEVIEKHAVDIVSDAIAAIAKAEGEQQ